MSKSTLEPWVLDSTDSVLTGLWRVRFPDNIPGLPENERNYGVAVVASESKARLIAAAPDMLEILKQVERTFGDRFPDVVEVIAKAEGRK